jgi:type III secretion protein Q
MSPSSASIHGRLRAIEQRQAEAQTALIAALNHREIDDLRTVARLASTRDRRAAAAWIKFDTRRGAIMIAPLLIDNQLARMTSGPDQPDGAAAAAALGRVEPLVAAVETILALELHPAGLSASPEGDPLLIRLDAHERSGALRHRLLIGAPPEIEVEPLPLPLELPARVGALALRWSGTIDLPLIPATRLGRLGRGDCILLGLGGLSGRLTLPGRPGHLPIAVDIRGGTAILHRDPQERDTNVSERISRVDDAAPALAGEQPGWAGLQIAATIEFDGGSLTAAELATLGKGSVLQLPAAGGVLAVRVVVGGATIAEGELVAVGEGFGVLVTAVQAGEGA